MRLLLLFVAYNAGREQPFGRSPTGTGTCVTQRPVVHPSASHRSHFPSSGIVLSPPPHAEASIKTLYGLKGTIFSTVLVDTDSSYISLRPGFLLPSPPRSRSGWTDTQTTPREQDTAENREVITWEQTEDPHRYTW